MIESAIAYLETFNAQTTTTVIVIVLLMLAVMSVLFTLRPVEDEIKGTGPNALSDDAVSLLLQFTTEPGDRVPIDYTEVVEAGELIRLGLAEAEGTANTDLLISLTLTPLGRMRLGGINKAMQ